MLDYNVNGISIKCFDTETRDQVLDNYKSAGLITQEDIDNMTVTDISGEMTDKDRKELEMLKMQEGFKLQASINDFVNVQNYPDLQTFAILEDVLVTKADKLISRGSFDRALAVINTITPDENITQAFIDYVKAELNNSRAKFPSFYTV